MISGLNDNIRYKNMEFHLQTEDGGMKSPVVTTCLFLNGAVLASRKTDYSHLAGTPGVEAELRQLMHRQHKELYKDLLEGRLDDTLGH